MNGTDEPFLTHVSHRAMACSFVVVLPPWHAAKVEVAVAALESLDEIESRLSVYRADSEISQINRAGVGQAVKVSADTFDVLSRAIEISRQTSGAFDVTAGPLVKAWGFMQRSGKKPTSAEIDAALKCVGYDAIDLDPDRRTVTLQKPGMQINLGGIGKGDAIDRVAGRLRENGINDFLLHGGQSSVFAAGNGDTDAVGWQLGIAHPTKPNRRIGGIRLLDAALGTSGSGQQFFHHRGVRYGHVIDPRTGYPGSDLSSLTVICDTAINADAIGTALFVEGARRSIALNHQWASSTTSSIDPLPSSGTHDGMSAAQSSANAEAAGEQMQDENVATLPTVRPRHHRGKFGAVFCRPGQRQDQVLVDLSGPIELFDIDLDLIDPQSLQAD
ncbi:FAD:protein FMN transferase [Crateriforma spongiae]|uniref:FAD:protein FMN transferase n=1 Tax=Crateriforma spongiae TaxID=2724528 RepID=UPI0014451EA2|nr:FAD:protein FMN transferase [Crateriforma spongiae]